jgi:hypothetical protein
VAGAALVLAACGSSNPPKKNSNAAAHNATTSSTSSTTSTTSAPSSSTSTTAASAVCAHVSAAPGQGQGAAGTITGTVTVTNTGSSPCTAMGYPTLALASGSGAPLTVTMVNGLSVDISEAANAAPTTVTLAPSGTAQFAYQFSDVPVGSETSCPTSESASVTMPGSTTSSPSFQLAIGPCGNGTIKVSPVYAGS